VSRSGHLTAQLFVGVILCLVLAGCDKFVDMRGTVRNSRGEAIAGAKIHLTNSHERWNIESRADGCFVDGGSVDPRASSEPLTVVAIGYKTASASVPMARIHLIQVIVTLVPSDSAAGSRIQLLTADDSKTLASCGESK
jgi:hypothetical protein